ncbi:PREDICTED: putative ATP synthase subunit f, mitochondrial [Trachymyrmex cornetzi]|uniref:Putative ATP synthase subunit f, mitochondrial n=1 Tax=Trachymyrmex cornetzi TaxID=471704 RepID=A0A151J0I3_9HYME|nr:PREDICTED: putative ATP synthase subunit f, mitochondrial [Trachymyrmex cornetzi]KYN14981.1 Putative ATP synthase subunit f, mitochondrial [Trachymyrmex cornetzi]
MENKLQFGGYPAEYDPVKHGPYDPARYYGKPDTPYLDLKLKEVPGWFARRQKSPQALIGVFSRAFWRWQHKYVQPKRTGIAPFFQVVVASMFVFYVMNYQKLRHHKLYKYH